MRAAAGVRTFAYVAGVCAILSFQFALSYPVATARGYPPLSKFWEIYAYYVPFVGIVFLPLCGGQRTVRLYSLGAMSVVSSLTLASIQANLDTPRPHINHQVGIGGVLYYDPIVVTARALAILVLMLPAIYVSEYACTCFWKAIFGTFHAIFKKLAIVKKVTTSS